ncbi:hypothetical protein ACFLZF_00760 [Nanoarchaeota archaeon]
MITKYNSTLKENIISTKSKNKPFVVWYDLSNLEGLYEKDMNEISETLGISKENLKISRTRKTESGLALKVEGITGSNFKNYLEIGGEKINAYLMYDQNLVSKKISPVKRKTNSENLETIGYQKYAMAA